jgi:hypothetical protein
MEGNNINIQLKGIARAGSDLSCEDGLCNEVVGLEYRDGSYIPVGFGSTSHSFSEDVRAMWIHKTTTQDNTLICHQSGNLYKVSWVEGNVDLVENLTKEIYKIGIVNNTIRIEDKVFLFFEGSYREINISNINFSMQLDVRRNGVALLHDWCDEKVQKELDYTDDSWEGNWVKSSLQKLESEVKSAEYLTGMAFMRYAIKLYDGTYINASTPVLVCDTLYDNLNNFKSVHTHAPDSLNFDTSIYANQNGVTYAVAQIGYLTNMGWRFKHTNKLDGIYEDNPTYKQNRLYELNTMTSGSVFFKEDFKWNTPKTLKGSYWNGSTYTPEFDNEDFSIGKTIIKETDIFSGNGPSTQIMQHYSNPSMKKDVRLPNDLSGYSNPTYRVWVTANTDENWFYDAIGPNDTYEDEFVYDFEVPSEFVYRAKSLGIYYDNGEQKTADNKIHQIFAMRNLATPVFTIINNLKEEYRNIVSSVDVFMTRPVSLFEDEMDYGTDEGNQRKFKSTTKIENELADSLIAFYKIYELPFEKIIQLGTDTSVYAPYIERGRISQIEQQETLPEPYGHIDYYNISFMLNNRLHIADITTKLTNNFNCDLSRLYPVLPPPAINKFYDGEILTRITITDSSINKTIYGKIKLPTNFNGYINPYIVYPDERAKKIELLGMLGGDYRSYYPFLNTRAYPLDAKNGYAVSKNLVPISLPEIGDQTDIPSDCDLINSYVERDKNIFKVSSVNNLINFPLIQTYQVGNGNIVGFASSTRALSQGQFGQYPLYVFTTEGIYAMEQTTTGTYASTQPISREVCCNPNGILQLDGSVLFTTVKGLMLLSGIEVVPFAPLLVGDIGLLPMLTSDVRKGQNVYYTAINDNRLVMMQSNISNEDFRIYVSDIDTRLSYIYDKNKVIIYNKKYNYSYLIDLQTQITTKIAKQILFDDNNYPSSKYGFYDDYAHDPTINTSNIEYKLTKGYTSTMFQTRPIKLGTYDLKSSFRVVVRGKFNIEEGKYAGVYVMGSNDAEEWMYLGGTERSGSFVDLGTTIHRVSCKYLMVVYVGSISHDSKINGLEISSEIKYNNKLK